MIVILLIIVVMLLFIVMLLIIVTLATLLLASVAGPDAAAGSVPLRLFCGKGRLDHIIYYHIRYCVVYIYIYILLLLSTLIYIYMYICVYIYIYICHICIHLSTLIQRAYVLSQPRVLEACPTRVPPGELCGTPTVLHRQV